MVTGSKSNILFVDDDPAILLTVGDRLQFEGYAVTKATSGEQALGLLKKMTPALIILDISMPGMGGIKFLREISGPDGRPRYPVLVFTARSNMEDFFSTINVDSFVAKSDDPDKLLREISRIIKAGGETKAPARPGAAIRSRQVLLGEDDKAFADLLSRHLKEAGYEVVCVDNGPKVVETALSHHPDIILLKLILPGMNGGTVASMLMDVLNRNLMPVILYDGTGLQPRDRQFRGVWRFLTSDLPKDLLTTVQEAERTLTAAT